MQRLASHTLYLPIFSIQDGGILGRVNKLVVNPDDFKIVALKIQMQTKLKPSYLLPHDIKLLGKDKVIIESSNDLCEDDDLVRLKPFLSHPFSLYGASVVTQSGKKLGKVSDFNFKPSDFAASKLYLQPKSIWRLFYSSHIVDRNMVIDVKDNKTVVVKDSTIKLQKTAPSILPAKS